jgi:hypothetical protein
MSMAGRLEFRVASGDAEFEQIKAKILAEL